MSYNFLKYSMTNIVLILDMISKIILVLTIITLASANLHLNIKYKNVLEGPEELTERIAQ